MRQDFYDDEQPRSDESWVEVFNPVAKKRQRRPPIYNPEDYVIFLKKWATSFTKTSGSSSGNDSTKSEKRFMEMSVKEPTDLSDLLKKLRQDVCLAFGSFLTEFKGDQCDGITLLLDVLKHIHFMQTDITGKSSPLTRESRISKLKRAVADEYECLLCVKHCVQTAHDAHKLAGYGGGLYGLAASTLSTFSKSRLVALELMTKACEAIKGHARISEALTTLRLNYGEPIRFKFLIGILNSAIHRGNVNDENGIRLLVQGLRFLNSFIASCKDLREQVVIQYELQEAGFNIDDFEQYSTGNRPVSRYLRTEISKWLENHVDITLMSQRLDHASLTNEALRRDFDELKSRLQELEEERKVFATLEETLKTRCESLEAQVKELQQQNDKAAKQAEDMRQNWQNTFESHVNAKTRESLFECPAGCGKLLQQGDVCNCYLLSDDITIDEVIEELNNLVNTAETAFKAEAEKLKQQQNEQIIEEELVAQQLPKAPRKEVPKVCDTVHLQEDLDGETSDGLSSPHDRYFDAELCIEEASDDDRIQPDILQTLPSSRNYPLHPKFAFATQFLEARSPLYYTHPDLQASKLYGSTENVTHQVTELEVGDVFKYKRMSCDFEVPKSSPSKKSFLPKMFRSKQNMPVYHYGEQEMQTSKQNAALMTDYRKTHFVPAPRPSPNPAQMQSFTKDRLFARDRRSLALPNEPTLVRIAHTSGLMDHPSGMY